MAKKDKETKEERKARITGAARESRDKFLKEEAELAERQAEYDRKEAERQQIAEQKRAERREGR